MDKPLWKANKKEQNKKQMAEAIRTFGGFLNKFRLETRGNRFKGDHWMVAVNKKTDKVLTEPGSRAHMKFGDSDEAMKEILKLIKTGELKI